MDMLEKLKRAQEHTGSLVCVGLDFDIEKIPPFFGQQFKSADSTTGLIVEFCKRIITATAPHACAYKPNMAFFEVYQGAGLTALKKIIEFIRLEYPNHFVILDAKRGDIGNTAKKYAAACKYFDPDAVTVNPYLGPGTLVPFLQEGLGIIALCVTTNPDAAVLQNATIAYNDGTTTTVYQHVAKTLKASMNTMAEAKPHWPKQLGLVAGATHPEELGDLRKAMGDDTLFLIPGIGKQEGALEQTVINNGRGAAVINASRSVLYASTGEDFEQAAAAEAEKLKREINEIRSRL